MKLSLLRVIRDQWTTVPPVAIADLTGQTVIVVGANVGLGFESAKHFAKMNPAKLILACRSEEKGNAAVAKIREETGYTPVLELLDLAKFSSVSAFVDRFLKNNSRLDILVANAAVATEQYKQTPDGWEESLQVNDLSTSLLCLLLAPRMVETGQKFNTKPRLVVVSSDVHYWTTFKDEVFEAKSAFQVLNNKEYGKMDSRYMDTKLLNVFFTRSLADWLVDTPLIVNCVNPGYCYSALRRFMVGFRAFLDRAMEITLARSQEEGGRQLTYAAVGSPEDPDRLRGQYISLHSIQEPSDYVLGSEGKKRQDILWNDLIAVLSEVDPRVREIIGNFSQHGLLSCSSVICINNSNLFFFGGLAEVMNFTPILIQQAPPFKLIDQEVSRTFIDFSDVTADQNTREVLVLHELVISENNASGTDSSGVPHVFKPENVALTDGALSLKVSAYSGQGNVLGAQVSTQSQIKYASVRTVQKSSKVPAVREGNFFFRDSNAEIDMTILMSTLFEQSECRREGIWARTKAADGDDKPTHRIFDFEFDPTEDFREYRIDWAPDAAYFYIDGKYQGLITENVPSVDGYWMWNAWSNGDPCWSAGPPNTDSITQIKSIDIITGYTDEVVGPNICPL